MDGKFFRLGDRKFHVKGVTYGPFAPNADGEPFASRSRTADDFRQAQELGANVLRVYHLPPRWMLDLALELGLRFLVDVPWSKHLCFLDSPRLQRDARESIRAAVAGAEGHPAVFAFSVVNEVPPDVVRWSGAADVARFVEDLVEVAKAADPDCLCTFGNYPPTEFLRPQNIDFHCYNVYLHHQRPFENYLARLQMIADVKPVMLGETGACSLREGEAAQAEMLAWQLESAFRAGLAGTVVYSFTDDWFTGGHQIEGWGFGLTTRGREPKPSFAAVQRAFAQAPYFPLATHPKVSVVVASYNGARTLRACLDSLETLNYPDYEVILIDDGSIDNTPQIAALYKNVRYFRQSNLGLSVARNTGIAAARGEIVAFTDSDCRADEDWLFYLVGDLLRSRFAGIGGHNFLPPDDSSVAAAVMVSPGGPAHVMLTDRMAEHIPGCNMAFYKWALDEIGGFDPVFRKAGDDVDVCWRLQERGYRIGFSPAGFVWHYRRSNVAAYLRQQKGYGEAEALLVRKHPEYFNSFGGSIWRGRIYTPSPFGIRLRSPIIYHGLFGSALFQTLYRSEPAVALMFCTSLEFHVLISLPLAVLSVPFPYLLPLAITSVVTSLLVCIAAAVQAELPRSKRRAWSRPLVALLYFLQPIWRGWARYQGRISLRPTPLAAGESLESLERRGRPDGLGLCEYWSEKPVDRLELVTALLRALDEQGWQSKTDAGWSEFDIEVFGSRWSHLQLTTVAEPHGGGKYLFRCRLKASWSLPAMIAFWAAVGFELLVIGYVGRAVPWLPMLLLSLWVFAWFLEQEQRDLQGLIGSLIDEVARRAGLTRVSPQKTAP